MSYTLELKEHKEGKWQYIKGFQVIIENKEDVMVAIEEIEDNLTCRRKYVDKYGKRKTDKYY